MMSTIDMAHMQLYIRLLVPCLVPMTYLLLSISVFHCSIQSRSKCLRAFLLPFFLCFAILSFNKSDSFLIILPSLSYLWAQSITLYIAHVTSLLFLEEGPDSQPIGFTSRASLRTTFRLWADPRLISLKQPANNKTTKSDGRQSAEPATEQETLSTFLFLRLAKLALYYLLHARILPALFSQTIGHLRAEDVSPARTPLLSRLGSVGAREALVRSHAAVAWIWESFILLDAANAAISVTAVLAGVDRPGDWPTLFGSPLAACGLRSFWSRFWHRLARRPHGNLGRAVARRALRPLLPARLLRGIGRPAVIESAAAACVVFFLSGVSHAAVSWRFGQLGWRFADVRWFMLNFLGCSLEKVVVSAGRRLAARAGWERELTAVEGSWLGWLVGYAWTFGFFFWSVPMLSFPRLYAQFVEEERLMRLLSEMRTVPGSV